MESPSSFSDVLEAIDRMTPDEQDALLRIIHRRLSDRGRQRVAEDVREARQEFDAGLCTEVSVDDLMDEILS